MNITTTNSPTIAELARGLLDCRTLVAGQSFYAAGSGVVVVVAPLTAEEAGECGSDHEFTVSTGFPPDPAAAGITVWVLHCGQHGGQLEKLGETDRFGSILFSAGTLGSEFQLTVTRSEVSRVVAEDAVTENPQSMIETVVETCPICQPATDDWTTKLNRLREGLECGSPVCRGHLCGPENVVLAAARDGWQQNTPEVFVACARLLADLLDEQGAVRRGFLKMHPPMTHNRVLNEVAGLLSTAIAIGHMMSKNMGRAAAAGRAAAVHLQAALRSELARDSGKAPSEWLTSHCEHPLDRLLARITPRLSGEWAQGLFEFRRLCEMIVPAKVEAV